MLNSLMDLTAAGGALGIPGLYVTGDPGAGDEAAKVGSLSIRLGLGWAKSHSFTTGQCPVMKYHRGLMNAILADKVHIGDAVNATVIGLEDAPAGVRRLRLRGGPQVRPRSAQHHRARSRQPDRVCPARAAAGSGCGPRGQPFSCPGSLTSGRSWTDGVGRWAVG